MSRTPRNLAVPLLAATVLLLAACGSGSGAAAGSGANQKAAAQSDTRSLRTLRIPGPAAVVQAVRVVNASTTWPWSVPVTSRKQPAAAVDNRQRSPDSSPRLMVVSS
jgi:hypothetical protein